MDRFIYLPEIVKQAIESHRFCLIPLRTYFLVAVDDEDCLISEYFSCYFRPFVVVIYGNRYYLTSINKVVRSNNITRIEFNYDKY